MRGNWESVRTHSVKASMEKPTTGPERSVMGSATKPMECAIYSSKGASTNMPESLGQKYSSKKGRPSKLVLLLGWGLRGWLNFCMR